MTADLVWNVIIIAAIATMIVMILMFWKLGTIRWPLFPVPEQTAKPTAEATEPNELDEADRIATYWYGGQYIPGFHSN